MSFTQYHGHDMMKGNRTMGMHLISDMLISVTITEKTEKAFILVMRFHASSSPSEDQASPTGIGCRGIQMSLSAIYGKAKRRQSCSIVELNRADMRF
jgi:hypothetical protein